MLEPRRLAARRAAEFMSLELGARIGETVGYRMRGESKVSTSTRIEVLTEGVLTRMLQHDAGLPGVALIIFDEFHERSIHADLSLAFALDVQQHLRPDLRVLIMSATLDDVRLSTILGDAPVVASQGRLFPIETRHAKFTSDKSVPARMAETILRALENHEGDVLAFLPGWREIQRTDEILHERRPPNDVVVRMLHGEASPASQNQALSPEPGGRRKIILATNIAETSLTIEGIRIVVDSGLVRTARFDQRRGMTELVTIPISRASAEQRKGRAGRQAPGVCYRLWTEAEHAQLTEYTLPEIKSADLVPLALELAQWGSPNGQNLHFIDPPSPANLGHAQGLLQNLGAVDAAGTITATGRAMAELPVHPRLAHMILRGKDLKLGSMACTLAAILEERDLFAGHKDADVDIRDRWREMRTIKTNSQNRILEQANRLRKILALRDTPEDDSKLGLLLAFAYPERIARQKAKATSRYVMVSGKQAILPPSSKMSRHEFLVIADADVRGTDVRVFLCASILKEALVEHFSGLIRSEDEVRWDPAEECVIARTATKLGAIVLSEQPLANEDTRIVSAMIDGIRSLGLHALTWEKDSISFRERNQWLFSSGLVNKPWPDLSDEVLTKSMDHWLTPFLTGIRQRSQLQKIDLVLALRFLFGRDQLRDLDRLAPSHLRLPSGTLAAVDYGPGHQPVLAVRLQELFGQIDTPRIGKGDKAVLIHLLSPAKRPLAVTQDLASFWRNTYPGIRRQLQSQYPKHVWPEDPLTAKPTSKTKKQLQRTHEQTGIPRNPGNR